MDQSGDKTLFLYEPSICKGLLSVNQFLYTNQIVPIACFSVIFRFKHKSFLKSLSYTKMFYIFAKHAKRCERFYFESLLTHTVLSNQSDRPVLVGRAFFVATAKAHA